MANDWVEFYTKLFVFGNFFELPTSTLPCIAMYSEDGVILVYYI